MKAHVNALLTKIGSATGWQTYFVSAPQKPVFPYVLVWSPAWSAGREASLDGTNEDLDVLVGVTAVAATPIGVLDMHASIRAVLCPTGRPTRLPVSGRSAWVQLEPNYGQPVQEDEDVTLESGFHPSFGVEMYRLRSTPSDTVPMVLGGWS